MKKVFAFILVLCMVLSCVPTFAEGTGTCGCTAADATSYLDKKDGTHAAYCAHGNVVKDVESCTYGYVDGVQICKKCNGTGDTCNHLSSAGNPAGKQLWTSENGQCWMYCTNCGKILTEKQAHEAAADATWSSTGTKTCKNCRQSIECAHDGGFDVQKNSAGDIDHTLVCKICGATSDTTNGEIPWGQCKDKDGNVIVGTDENGVTGTCESKTCVICNNTFKGALPHEWVNDAVDAGDGTHYQKCSKCGQAIIAEDGSVDSWSHDNFVSAVVNGKHVHKCGSCDAKVGDCDATYVKIGEVMCMLNCEICNPSKTAVAHVWSENADEDGNYTCQNCGAKCEHADVSFVEGSAPTCTKAGKTDGWQCNKCGVFTVEQKEIKAINHANAKVTVLQAATCYQNGLKHIDCPDCGFVGTETIKSETAHNYVKTGCFADKDGETAACTGDNAKKCALATCTAKGMDHYVCSICGNATHKESKALGHDMSKTVYSNSKDGLTEEVTCLQPVYSFTQCSRCNALSTDYKVVKATGDAKHQLTKTKQITPTCTTEGGTKKFCENVGCTYDEWVGEYGKIGDDGKHAEIKDCTKVVVKTVTCTTDGEYYYICKDCSARLDKDGKELAAGKNAIVKAEGHSNAGDLGSCLEDHIDLNGVWTYVAATCKTNGYWESTCSKCNGNYRKVSFADKCEVCKADASNHDWVMGAIKTEAVCGKEEGTAQTICSVCGTIAKHNGGSDCICKNLSDRVHTCAEMINDDPAGKDILWKISKEHDYQVTNDTYKKPTCKENGYGYKTCSRCGEKEWFDEIPAVKCKNSKTIKVYVPATCAKPAYNKLICSVCNAELGTDSIGEGQDGYEVKTGHSYYRMGTAKLCNYGTVAKFGCKNCDYVEYQKLDGKAGESTPLTHDEVNDKFTKEAYKAADSKTAYIDEFVWIAGVNCTEDGYYLFGACPKCDFVGTNAEVKQTPAFHLEEKELTEKHTAANCVDPEYDYFECTECGEEWKVANGNKLLKDQISNDSAIGHKDWIVVKYIVKETCTENGKGVYGCPYCGVTAKYEDGKEKVETVPAAHTWSKDLVVDKAPSCGFEGSGHKICTICGEEKDSETIKPTGKCTFGTTTINSGNCLEKGYVVYECLVCHKGATKAQIEAAGYKNNTENGYKDPVTLTTKSYTFNEKSRKWEESENAVETVKVIDHIVAVLAPASTHVFGASEIREATCELEGGLRHTCTICGFEEFIGTTATAALGHDVVRTVTPANCYVDGKEVYSCVRCGKTLYTKTLDALKHVGINDNIDKSLSVASTCATRGYNVCVCKNDGCGYTKKEMLPINPANHKYVIDTTIREATCTNNGLAFAHCEYCDWEGLYSIAANHKWEVASVKLAPTCTSKGVNNEKCSVCGATRTAETKALGHTMVTKVVEADCENVAGILTYCSVCSYKTNFIKTGSMELGHVWGAKVFVDATCEKAAHYESTCARCSKVAVTEIAASEPYYKAALDHKGKKLIEKFDGNCMEKAYELYCCPICGENVKVEAKAINTNAHDWEITFTYGTKEVNCGNGGYVDAKCKICGNTVKMKYLKPDHSWTENIITDEIVYKVCTVCGEMDVIWTASNFTGYKGCLTWNGSKWVGSHKGLVVKASKAATCTEAGELGHIECTVCGTVVRVGGVVPAHTTKEVAAVEATCTTEGSTAGTFCLVCNKYVVAPQKIAAKGHKWVEVPAQEATATKPGYTAGTQCENCKEWKEGHEETPVKAASLKRTAVLRKTAELLGERVALLNTDDAISITGELVNGFYPVSSADGTGYIHNSYIAVA